MNDDTPRPLFKDLAHDSPALLRDIKGTIPSVLAQACAAYAIAAPLFDPHSEHLERPAGANFNSKLARLAQILIREAAIEQIDAINACFFVCLDFDALPQLQQHHPEMAKAVSLAREVSRFPQPISENGESIAAAMILDELRHLHMRTEAHPVLQARLEEIQTQLIPAIMHPQNDRLQELAIAAADRLARHFFKHVQ